MRHGTSGSVRPALVALVLAIALGAAVATAAERPGPPGECTDLRPAHCAGADLTFANLLAADLRGADLRGATLNGALLHSASLAGADARRADLRATTLVGADLHGTALAGANLADANLEHARLAAGGLRDAYLCRTRLPDGRISERDCAQAVPPPAVPSVLQASPRAARAAPAPQLPQAKPTRAPALRPAKARAKRALVKVTVRGPGRVVARRGGLRCPSRCKARYRRGTELSLRAVAQPGARFVKWSGACSGRRACTLKVGPVRRNRVVATFAVVGCALPADRDTDGDGLPDCMELAGWEMPVTTPQRLAGAGGPATITVRSDLGNPDTDGDGLDDGDEFAFLANPGKRDTDSDGLGDASEIRTHRSAANHADSDGDSLPPAGGPRDSRLFDGREVVTLGTAPRLADTDGDGLSDYVEATQEQTNPLVADLPRVALVAVPGRSNPELDLDYTVEETTGTEQEQASTTGITTSSESSTETSRETENEHSFESETKGECGFKGSEIGCSVSQKFTVGTRNTVTEGTRSEFSNSREMSQEHEQIASTSAERRVELAPTGCMQVVLRLENQGPVSVTVGNIEALAFTPDQDTPNSSRLLAALQPIQGDIAQQTCPATDPGYGPVELAPGAGADVAFGQRVNSRRILEYLSNPTPISYELGPITMAGTDLVGNRVDFLGETATKVRNRDARIEVNFGDGTIASYDVAASRTFGDDGKVAGVTLGEALGPQFANLDPVYTDGSPSGIRALRNPETGAVKANAPDLSDGVWTVFGEAFGIGNPGASWRDYVLHPGQVVTLLYARDSDRDGLPDGYERSLGTNPQATDTDGDGAACSALPNQPPSPSDPAPAEWPQGCRDAWEDRQADPESPYFDSSDYFESKIGWTVPFARGQESEYRVFPSPLACDIDGDGSPDGPGPGNGQFGECPDSEFASELERLTDPERADTNGDGLPDGSQALPDALRAVPRGGRLPVKVREWGGPGELGNAEAFGIAVDTNQPAFDEQGRALPLNSYVIQRFHTGDQTDAVVRFIGNPRLGTPYRDRAMFPDEATFPGNGSATFAATGIDVAPGTVGSGDSAGSPVVVNYHARDLGTVADPNGGTAAFTTFNGTTGEDVGRSGNGGVYGAYGGLCCFEPPIFPPGEASLGNGFLEAASPNSVIIGHGRHKFSLLHNNQDPAALPSRYFGRGDPVADQTFRYGRKAADRTAPVAGELVDPSGVAVDRENGKLYVADDLSADIDVDEEDATLTGTLTRFDLSRGRVDRFASSTTGVLANIRGLAVDPDGPYLYAASAHCGVVYKLSESLSILGAIGGSPCEAEAGGSEFERPEDVEVDAANGVWVADSRTSLLHFYFYPFGPT